MLKRTVGVKAKKKNIKTESVEFSEGKTKNYIWMSSSFHEDPYSDATRAALEFAMADGDLFTPEENRIIRNAVTKGNIKRQLAALVGDNQQIMDEINRSTSTAAAYAYQFWLAGDLHIGVQTNSVFETLLQFIKDILGIITDEENTAEIFRQLAAGQFLLRKQGNTNFTITSRLTDTPALSTANEQIRRTNNPELIALKNQLVSDVTATNVNQAMVSARNTKIAQFIGDLHSIIGEDEYASDEAFGKHISDVMNRLSKPDSAKTKKVKGQIEKLLDRMYIYARDAGVSINYVKGYFPRIADTEKMEANRNLFLSNMSKKKYNDHLAQLLGKKEGTVLTATERVKAADLVYNAYQRALGDSETAADELLREAEEGAALVSKIGAPAAGRTMERTFGWIHQNDTAPFLDDRIGLTLTKYITQLVKRSEFIRRFGVDKYGKALSGRKSITEYMEQARYLGATEEQMKLADNYVKSVMGTLAIDKISPEMHKAQGWLIVVQNYAVLGLATITSLLDVIGIAVRSDLDTAWFAYKAGIKDVIEGIKAEGEQSSTKFGEMLGTIDRVTANDALGFEFGGYHITGSAKRANDALFRMNGLIGWTNWTRNVATVAGKEFIRKHVAEPTENSARFLDELNISAKEVDTSSENLGILEQEERAKLHDKMRKLRIKVANAEGKYIGSINAKLEEVHKQLDKDDRLRGALVRFVDEAVLRPDASQRPIWGSDPRFALIMHLKAFTFSFHERILRRIYQEALHGNYTPLMTSVVYVPAALMTIMARDLLTMDDDDEDETLWGATMQGADRAGVFGTFQFAINARNDVTRGGVGLESFSGPTIDWAGKWAEAISTFDGDLDKEGSALARSSPGYVIWKDWFD
jgi:hypothetical protein